MRLLGAGLGGWNFSKAELMAIPENSYEPTRDVFSSFRLESGEFQQPFGRAIVSNVGIELPIWEVYRPKLVAV